MIIADQVCSPDQAVFFEAAGLKLPTQFWWVSFVDRDAPADVRGVRQHKCMTLDECWRDYEGNPRYRELKRVRAYNCAELGALLPATPDRFFYSFQAYYQFACVECVMDQVQHYGALYPNEAQARAAVLQRLIETARVQVTELQYVSNKEIMGSTS